MTTGAISGFVFGPETGVGDFLIAMTDGSMLVIGAATVVKVNDEVIPRLTTDGVARKASLLQWVSSAVDPRVIAVATGSPAFMLETVLLSDGVLS
jgi:hypothetical protein